MSTIRSRDRRLYNKDLAPTDKKKKNWGWFEIFNVWANDVQSLFGYTLAASLFLTYGLNGWAVFLAILLAGFFIMWLVNLSGAPSVKHGIPYPVFARASMGVIGANFPAMVRLKGLSGSDGGAAILLGMNGIEWISFIFVAGFQIYLFWQGIDLIRRFLNFAGPAVYAVMIILMLVIWVKAGGSLLSEVGTIFSGVGDYSGGAFAAFLAIFGTMVAYFAAVVINFGDFSRFVKNEKEMRKGNLWGLPGNIFLFSFITLMVTAGTVSVFGETITNPTEMVARVGNLGLTVIAAFAFFAATIGINMVANFIPPAYDLANLMPSKIDFRRGGLITSIVGFIIGALWVSFISKVGMFPFVNTLGAILAPVYGIMIVDYYVIKKGRLDINQLFSTKKGGKYYYDDGWNQKAFVAWTIAGVFSVLTVWHPALSGLGGYAWIIGAALGTVLHLIMSGKKTRR
jgi:NCS1 family nucleobase:cation symporter-1